MSRPKVEMQALVDLDDSVLLIFYDKNLSQTVHLTPEQAIEVGYVGKMAEQRAKVRKEQDNA